MTEKQFWKKLDIISKKKPTTENLVEFANVLLDGCEGDLYILIQCIDDPYEEGVGKQAYIGEPDFRMMMCYTSYEHGHAEQRLLPPGDNRTLSISKAKCRDVIDNMLSKPVIKGLVFNSDCDEPFLLPKEIIQILCQPFPPPLIIEQ